MKMKQIGVMSVLFFISFCQLGFAEKTFSAKIKVLSQDSQVSEKCQTAMKSLKNYLENGLSNVFLEDKKIQMYMVKSVKQDDTVSDAKVAFIEGVLTKGDSSCNDGQSKEVCVYQGNIYPITYSITSKKALASTVITLDQSTQEISLTLQKKLGDEICVKKMKFPKINQERARGAAWE